MRGITHPFKLYIIWKRRVSGIDIKWFDTNILILSPQWSAEDWSPPHWAAEDWSQILLNIRSNENGTFAIIMSYYKVVQKIKESVPSRPCSCNVDHSFECHLYA